MSDQSPNRPTLVVTRKLPQAVEDYLAKHFEATFNPEDKPFSSDELLSALKNAEALLPTAADKLPAHLLQSEGLQTKVIANFGVGYDNIAADAARAAGIAVTNTPGVLTDCTADTAVMLMLMAARNATLSERMLREGGWKGFAPTMMLGQQVTGKTLGIIGMGRIGKAVAKRCHFGFGMDVVFFNRSEMDKAEAAKFGARQLDTIENVLAVADFVSLHCPGGAANRHLFDAKRIAQMKSSAYLINTARGDVVDENALIAALQTGTIAGAGLDVFEQEPSVPTALMQLDNVSLLPHIGSGSVETRTAMGLKAANNLVAFFKGETPPDQVN